MFPAPPVAQTSACPPQPQQHCSSSSFAAPSFFAKTAGCHQERPFNSSTNTLTSSRRRRPVHPGVVSRIVNEPDHYRRVRPSPDQMQRLVKLQPVPRQFKRPAHLVSAGILLVRDQPEPIPVRRDPRVATVFRFLQFPSIGHESALAVQIVRQVHFRPSRCKLYLARRSHQLIHPCAVFLALAAAAVSSAPASTPAAITAPVTPRLFLAISRLVAILFIQDPRAENRLPWLHCRLPLGRRRDRSIRGNAPRLRPRGCLRAEGSCRNAAQRKCDSGNEKKGAGCTCSPS